MQETAKTDTINRVVVSSSGYNDWGLTILPALSRITLFSGPPAFHGFVNVAPLLLFLVLPLAFSHASSQLGSHDFGRAHYHETKTESLGRFNRANGVVPTSGDDFSETLDSVVSISVTGKPLRPFLRELSSQYGIAIFLDRRINPSREITFNSKNSTLLWMLYTLAGQSKAGICIVDNVVYFGPRSAAMEFPFELDQAHANLKKVRDSRLRKKWLKQVELSWQRLAIPREIALDLAKQNEIDLRGAADLPHDIWPAGTLPRMSVLNQLAFLSVGFNRYVQVDTDGNKFSLKALRIKEKVTTYYPVPNVNQYKKKLASVAPDAEFKTRGSTILVTAVCKDHYNIRRFLAQDRSQLLVSRAVSERRKVVISMETEAKIGSVLNTAASYLEVELKYSPSIQTQLEKRIKLNVSKITYIELIKKSLAGTDLEFELTDDRLRIFKK